MKFLLTSLVALLVQAAPASLRIVVLEGEGAVNIIQQKTAVAPVIEVRDRNNLPVGGATVTFSIQGGNTAAFAGGSQTLTVTTNAAGRAVAAAVNPLSSGTVQIQATAAFQGQTAAATITQTNVMTAAQASASAAGAAGGGAGGGGGLGGGAIAGIAGGVATAAGAGVLLSKKEEDGGGEAPSGAGPPGASQPQTNVIPAEVQAALGTYTLQTINGAGLPAVSVTAPPATCRVITDNATLTLRATQNNQERFYELNETSRTDCGPGPSTNFNSGSNGTWNVSGTAITFTSNNDNFLLDNGTLNGSTLTHTARPPHIDAGREAPRVTLVWRK